MDRNAAAQSLIHVITGFDKDNDEHCTFHTNAVIVARMARSVAAKAWSVDRHIGANHSFIAK